MHKYRLYIDEVGNSDLKSSRNPNHRYLSLTGVILDLDYVMNVIYPELEDFKCRFFNSHPDEPIILHRKELVNKKPPFTALREPEIEQAFNRELLEKLTTWQYVVITATIDKMRHMEQYQVWRYDPYYYCLKILMERFVLWLKKHHHHSVGDVLAESRGGNEDMRLKKSFTRVYEEGSEWVRTVDFQTYLTSGQLKVKPKSNNISGLQLADLVAYPSYKATLSRRNGEALPQNFGGQIAAILEDAKYDRSPSGRVDGWGRKWLP